MNLELIPYVEIDGTRTLPDSALDACYRQMHEDDTFTSVFFDGKMREAEEFRAYVKDPENLFVFPAIDRRIVGFAWLNNMVGRRASAHFCMFSPVWGRGAVEIGKRLVDYWLGFAEDGRPALNVILGMTPATNRKALAYIRRVGFQIAGEIPQMLYNAYTGEHEPAVFSYRTR